MPLEAGTHGTATYLANNAGVLESNRPASNINHILYFYIPNGVILESQGFFGNKHIFGQWCIHILLSRSHLESCYPILVGF